MRFAGALGALIAFAVLAAAGAAPAAGSKEKKLSKHDQALLAKAEAQGKDTVVVIIASKSGASGDIARVIEAQGGSILNSDASLGYVLARIPTGKVEGVATLDGIEALDLDEVIPLPDPSPGGAVAPTPQTPPSAATPNNNPYLPIGDTGSSQFMAAHPTWDGRGITIGILDTGIDLDHPSLNTTSTGERKIVDWVTGTLPSENDPTWVDMSTEVTAVGGSFTVGTTTYTAADGIYRFGTFNERSPLLGGEVGSDVNRDGNPAGSSGIFAVLWKGDKVWVDANQNNNFADGPAMTDYKKNFDVGHFGTDNPATAVRESMPFVVQTEPKTKFVNIGIVSAQHGSHVAGIAAGNHLFGGAMSGAAPGAKIVSLRACLFVAGCTAAALTDGMVYVAKVANADVINMSIGGLPALNDGNNARGLLYQRLIDQEQVQMFISAGNDGAGANTVGDPSVAPDVMSVGSYISKASWQSNYGSTSPFDDNLHGFSSRGPREDGGFKPQIVAPGSAVSTTPLWQPGGPVPGTYTLPPGYSMLNGTSMAAPESTGAAALLLSAANQVGGVQTKPEQIREAFTSSARLLDDVTGRLQTYEQGAGIINVGAAWTLLSTNLKTVGITSSVAVNSVLSGFLATPGFGQGIYDREGVKAGDSYTRTYTFARTSGPNTAITYNLSWLGNDGTFSTAASISLKKNQPATLDVTVNPTTSGIHSAILLLNDPTTPGIEYQTQNVVIAAEEFNAGNSFSITHSGSIGINQTESYFFRVPAGTPAFKVDFSGPSATPGTGQARFLRIHPFGVSIDSNQSTSCYSPSAGSCAGSPLSRTTSNPQTGVWEVVVEARRTSDALFTPYTLTASILGATVSPNPDTIASATIGVPIARSYTLTNVFGPFTGRAVGTTFGSAKVATPSIANHAQLEFPVTVTSGSTSLRATIGSPSDPAADLDLFVFNCTSGTCVQAGANADGDSEESVTIANPAAGDWKVLVDGFSVPAGTTTFNYVDVFVNAAFGSVSVTDANALRASGSSWTVPGSVVANAAPASGRVLLGNVQVRTDTNILVGSGDVIVQNVTP